MDNTRPFLFTVRGYNDLDQNCPIIYYLLSRKIPVDIIFLTDNVDLCDFRISFLREIGGDLFNIIELSPASFGLAYNNKFLSKQFYRIWERSNLFRTIVLKICHSKKASDALALISKYRCICFEWGTPQSRGIVNEILFRASVAMEVPRVAVPHGCNVFANGGSNRPFANKKFWWSARRLERLPLYYSKFFVQNPTRRRQLSASYLHSGNFFTIGSMRFNRQWCDILSTITPEVDFSDSKKLKVLLMDFQVGYGISRECYLSLIRGLARITDIEFSIKLSTRENKSFLTSIPFGERIKIFDAKDHSIKLIERSDVVISFGSSIAIQVLQSDRLLITPSFLGVNKSIFEEWNVGLHFHTTDGLLSSIQELAEGSSSLTQCIEQQQISKGKVDDEYLLQEDFFRLGDQFLEAVLDA